MKTTTMKNISEEQLLALNGGGFVYDLGRAIRFLIISGGGANTINAIIDWNATTIANEIINP